MLLNNPIKAFAYSKDQDILKISSAINTLNELTIPNSYIFSAYVYNRQIDTIITKETFYDGADFYDKEIMQMLKNPTLDNTQSHFPIARTISIPGISKALEANVYTYILFDTNDHNGNFDSAIVLNVDAEWLRLTISSLDNKTGKNGNEIFVLDENGDIVSHSSPAMFNKNISEEAYIRNVQTATAPSGSFISKLNNKKYVISYVSSNVLKWKFISVTPYDTVFSSVKKNGVITIVFCFIVLLLGLLFSFLASRKLYNPIGVLENIKRDAAPLLKNEFLKSLVTGRSYLPLDKLTRKETELNIDVSFKHNLFLFMFRIDFYKDFVNQHNEKDRALYKYAIANICREITAEHYRNEVMETAFDQFTVVADIGIRTQLTPQLMEQFHSIVEKIQSNVNEYLNISLTGTLGYMIESPDKFKSAYEDTLNLSMYRIKTGHFSIITPEMINEVEAGSFMFPASKEKQLIDALKLGSGDTAKEIYRDMIKTIEHSSYDNIITSVIYLFFSIYNSLNRIVEGSQSKFNSISIDFFNRVSGFETFEEIEQTFFELIDDIILLKDGAKDRKKNEIVNAAIEMIHLSYSDKNLSLNSCAESLSLSSVYLGKLFKSTTGKSMAEYITMVRMEKIKEYLEQKRLPINEILDKCGMEKSNYFYTSFKKYFGVSLSEYRLNHVKVNGEMENM